MLSVIGTILALMRLIMPNYLRVKNWREFQVYKDRKPPFLRLYRKLLKDPTFMGLSDAQRWHLVGCWLLAADTVEGTLPLDEEQARFELRPTLEDPILQPLIDAGFLIVQDDTEPYSPVQSRTKTTKIIQNDTPENRVQSTESTEYRAQNGLSASDVVEEWNKIAEQLGLERCRNLGKTRSGQFRARRKEAFFRENWREAMADIPNLEAFYILRTPGKWCINLEFFLRPDSVAKILEKTEAPTDKPEPEPTWYSEPVPMYQETDEAVQARIARDIESKAAFIAQHGEASV